MIKAHYVIRVTLELADAESYCGLGTWEDAAKSEGEQLAVIHDAGAELHFDVSFARLDGANASDKLPEDEP